MKLAILGSWLSSSSEMLTATPTLIKITTFSFFSIFLFFIFKHFSDTSSSPFSFFSFPSTIMITTTTTNSSISPPPVPPLAVIRHVVERTGILDGNGVMTDEFVVGEYDSSVIESVVIKNESVVESERVRVGKFRVCDEGMREYVPCLDNKEVFSRLNSTERGEKYERHCPATNGGGGYLDCLVPQPKGYKRHIPWPTSRNEVWFNNVPHTRLVEDKGGQNWISRKNDKFIFPGGGTQFIHGAGQYLDQIAKMVPDIAFGQRIRVALDVGCGVASFGAFLLDRNVTTLSIAPKDGHENQIQFALERGVPSMIAAFATRHLLHPSQVNRMLRAGGYFIWAAQPVYKHEDNLQEQWKEMKDLTSRICWELVKKEGYIAIWQKPLNNSCYLGRDLGARPPICDANDDPDNVWYVGLKACISQLPDNGYGANVSTWPALLHYPPARLLSIEMDADKSRKDIYRAESKYLKDIVDGYVSVFHLKEQNIRNVMDMRARYGGYAAALHDYGVDCWVMNVVPISDTNTLPVIYDRGLIGVMHDWCEPFDTYPRTYDLLNAEGLFSIEQKRCNISTIMLEMDRILRPGGHAYIRDLASVMDEIHEITGAMGWVCFLYDTIEGPHSALKLLKCEKRL